MQVSVTANGLERRMVVQVPAQRIDSEVQKRLKSLSQRARVDGFRPGKAPFRVIENRYGKEVRDEVRGEIVQSSFHEAVTQEKLRLAGRPSIELQSSETGLEYTATFEVYPEFELAPMGDAKIEKPAAGITEQDVDKMIEKLRIQHASWHPVDREARKGDRVVMEFRGTLDGVDFSGNQAKDFPVVLGSGALIPGFEDQIEGVKAGETREFDLRFPDAYHSDMAGKTAHFTVQAATVNESRLPELDEAFFASFGVSEGGLEALRKEVRASMQRELDQAIKSRVKNQVMDALLAMNAITLPKALVQEEAERLKQQEAGQMAARAGRLAEYLETLEQRAQRRVALGLIIAEIIKKNGLKAEPEKLRAAVESVAASYDDPSEVINWYYASRDRLANVEALVLEDEAVDWVVHQARIVDRAMGFYEVTGAPVPA